jgi:hypothetical protein
MAHMVTCEFCGLQMDVNASNVMRKISCWAQNNTSGKPAKIVDPVDFRMYVHSFCYDGYMRGGSVEQNALF